MESFKLYIDGRFDAGSATFASLNPATGEPWAQIAEARAQDVDRAVAAAHRAFQGAEWRDMTAGARGKLLLRLADLLEQHAPELARLETLDTGKIIRETQAQIAYVAEYYRYYAGLADKMEGSVLAIDKPDMETWVRREPIGVVAAIVPWNSQLFLAAVKIGPAIAAGCTLVVKAAETAPAPLLAFARLIDEAGFPRGVCNVITGFAADCGAVLTAHPQVDHIAFTGGAETAKHIVRGSAENLASTSLELGGKSPFIVFDDADLTSAANAQVAAIFAASGQSCVAGSRLLVAESIKDAFLARLTEKVRSIRIGPPDRPDTPVRAALYPAAARADRRHRQPLAGAGGETGGWPCGNRFTRLLLPADDRRLQCATRRRVRKARAVRPGAVGVDLQGRSGGDSACQ